MELFKKKNIVNDIIDEAMDINFNSSRLLGYYKGRKFRLWVTSKVFKKINKFTKSYTTYRTSGVPKANGDTDYGVKTFVVMGLTFYVSIDNDIKDFKLIKINDKI